MVLISITFPSVIAVHTISDSPWDSGKMEEGEGERRRRGMTFGRWEESKQGERRKEMGEGIDESERKRMGSGQ